MFFSEYSGESLQRPAYGPASHPSSSSASSSSSAFRPVVPSRQIVERQPRMLDFRVEYRDRNVDVVLEDSSTVGKKLLRGEKQDQTKYQIYLPTIIQICVRAEIGRALVSPGRTDL